MKRIIFYYNHYNTLGHSTRVFSLVAGLKRRYKDRVDIALLQGGIKQPILPFEKYAEVFTLPYSMDRRGLFLEERQRFYANLISDAGIKPLLNRRMKVIKNVIDRYRPDIFITEYFPFGREFWTFEVPHILKYIKDNSKCRIISSSGYLSCIEDTHRHIKEYYDRMLIHSPVEFAQDYRFYLHKNGADQIRRVFADFPDKIEFTGFILDQQRDQGWQRLRRSCLGKSYGRLVLVSRGGGIVNRKIIIASILCARIVKDAYFVICCGPATSDKEFTEYRSLAGKTRNMLLKKEIPVERFGMYLKASDISVSMAGYNTCVKLLYYGKKSILVPYNTYEQNWRAEVITRYLPSRVIRESKLTVSSLQNALTALSEAESTVKPIGSDWFDGVNRSISSLWRRL